MRPLSITTTAAILLLAARASAFEGQITATLTRGGETQTFLYTVGTNALRIERTETNWPHAKNIVALDTGDITLLFPHNRSFVRLKPASSCATPSAPPRFPAMPAPPPGIGPQSLPAGMPGIAGVPSGPAAIGPTNLPGVSAMSQMSRPSAMPNMPSPPPGLPSGIGPQAGSMSSLPGMPAGMLAMGGGMPMMPMMPMGMMEKPEFKATGEKTNLLGFVCQKFEIRQRGDLMEIWATDQLMPFQSWLQNQPPQFGPRMIEEQWGELLKTKKLFPLLAVLRFEPLSAPGDATPPPPASERLRFEVQSVTPLKITNSAVFQAPPHYVELQPLPF